MATWNDIKAWFQAQNLNFKDGGDVIDTSFRYENGRTQQIRIVYTPLNNGIETVQLMSPIAPYNPSKSEQLLLEAFHRTGGIVIQETDGGRYFVLKVTVPIADLDASEIEFYLNAVSINADELEHEAYGVDNL